METKRITVQDVVDAYKGKGLKAAKGWTGIQNNGNGVWEPYVGASAELQGCHCALGALALGRPMDWTSYSSFSQYVEREFGVGYRSFYCGFDDATEYDLAYGRGEPGWSEDDYRLGVACREAVIAAGIEWTP